MGFVPPGPIFEALKIKFRMNNIKISVCGTSGAVLLTAFFFRHVCNVVGQFIVLDITISGDR